MASRVIEEMQDEEVKLELTPMIDISFLIIIFFMCLPFKTLAGKLEAFLPKDSGPFPNSVQPPESVKIRIRTGATRDDSTTAMPSDPTPKWGSLIRRASALQS